MRLGVGGRRLLLAAGVVAASVAAQHPAAAHAASLAAGCPSLNGSPAATTTTVSPSDGNPFLLCSYTGADRVHSFEGTPLRVDLSLPLTPYIPAGTTTPARSPLVIFQSGYSNDYCQFESTTLAGSSVPGCSDFIGTAGYHWNNAWFASNGYATINFTPRGWYESCGKQLPTYSYASDPECQAATSGNPQEASWVHLYDRRFEIRDAQFLAGVVADAESTINPNQVVATGDSGGGGPSWDEALSQDQVVQLGSTPTSVVTSPWKSQQNIPLHLVAAFPMYTWTNLIDSLLPNGTSTDGLSGAPPTTSFSPSSPLGVEKESYVAGLFAKGVTNVPTDPQNGAQYAVPGVGDPTADLDTWFAEINAGEPAFEAFPNTPTVVAQVGGQLRSPFAIPVPVDTSDAAPSLNKEKPIFVMQGLTDPLFPGLQVTTMINRLQAADPNYPVRAFFGDIGHANAQNPLDVWQQAHDQSNAFLDAALRATSLTNFSSLLAQPTVTVDTTRCLPEQTLQAFQGSSFATIATSQLAFTDAGPAQATSNPSGGVEGPLDDPIVTGSKCISMPASDNDVGQASYAFAVTSPSTLVGSPVVSVSATITGSSAELAARLWDVDPSGNKTLITRSVYRLAPATPSTQPVPLSFEMWPNAWQICNGDSLKLELKQTDAPTFRPDNEPSTMSLSGLRMSLPVVAGAACQAPTAVAESPLTPALPLLAAAGLAAIGVRRRRLARVAG
jgi:hypothetical protein